MGRQKNEHSMNLTTYYKTGVKTYLKQKLYKKVTVDKQ